MARKKATARTERTQCEERISEDYMEAGLEGQIDEGNPIHPEEQEEPTTVTESPVEEVPISDGQPERHDPYDLSKLGLSTKYVVQTVLIFGDCAVQPTEEKLCDVLLRNFENPGSLSWWLNRINYGYLTRYAKGKDILDYARVVSRDLFKSLKRIGKPEARW